MERLEQRFGFLSSHADAFVGDGKYSDGNPVRDLVCGPKPKATATGHRAQAIGREIPDDLTDVVFITLDHDLVSRRFDVHGMSFAYLGAVPQQRSRVLDHRSQIQLLNFKALRPSICEKRPDRGVEPFGFAQNDIHQLCLIAGQR